MTTDAPLEEPLLQLLDALAQHQLRNAGAEVAAAIAHALGTPLNVISGRAELIRQDPGNALAQVTRIEEQVRKVATGLRQLVDYLAVPEPSATPATTPDRLLPTFGLAGSGASRPAGGAPSSSPSTLPSGGVAPPQVPQTPAEPLPSPRTVPAGLVLEDLLALAGPVARANGAELVVDGSALGDAVVDRWHALSTLSALVSSAVRHASTLGVGTGAGARGPRVGVSAAAAPGGVVFELSVPGLEALEGWQLEHFQTRPASNCSEFYRTLSIVATVVRGRGGRLQIEASGAAGGSIVRFTCRDDPGVS